MNFHRSKSFSFIARWFSAALLLIVLAQAAHAQQKQAERWLFVFDTSYQMKKDLPATITTLEQMLGTSAGGQLNAGDSVAVWTYDQKLHTSGFPLIGWNPIQAADISSSIVTYLKRQRHRGDSSLAAVQPELQHVIAISERLTIIIFCDGESSLQGTPYDNGVNQNFRSGLADRKKNRQPFVVALRTQLGEFVNCTVAFPPGNISFPPFPKLPPPPETNKPTPPKAPPAPPAVRVITGPPLVIVGTNVSTNLNATVAKAPPSSTSTNAVPTEAPVQAASQPTNQPATVAPTGPAAASTKTNAPAAGATHVATNVTLVASSPPNAPKPSLTETAATPVITAAASQSPAASVAKPASAGDTAEQQTRILIWIGVGLLAAAVVLVILLLVRPGHRPRGSLISHSMQDDPRRK